MSHIAPPTGSGAHGADTSGRDFLTLMTATVGGLGAASALWPFISSMNPAKDVLAQATTEVDLSPIQLGQRVTVVWRGKPVWIDHRPAEEIEKAEQVNLAELRDPQ